MSYKNISKTVDDYIEDSQILHNKNIILYDDISKRKLQLKEGQKFNVLGLAREEEKELLEALKNSFNIITNKQHLDNYGEVIKECFEISCYVLYDRQIHKEVIDKQKNYEIDYVVDFFKYVLRMFVKRQGAVMMLTRYQCKDIKDLCKKILNANGLLDQYESIINRSSAKDITEYFRIIVE